MSVVMQKPVRSDAGKTRVMGRDAAALSWIYEMRAITEPDLGVLLGQIAERGEPITTAGASAVVRRWKTLGLAQAQRILVGGPRVVTLTQAGADLIGDGRYTAPAWTQMTHTVSVARARLLIEHLRDDVAEWTSERSFRRDRSAEVKRGLHVPDGEVVLTDGSTAAVEVELTSKGVDGVVRVLERVASYRSYDAVLYFVPDAAMARTVTTAVERCKQLAMTWPVAMRPVEVTILPPDLAAAVRDGRTGLGA